MHGSTIFLLFIIIGLGAAFYFIYNKFKKIEDENSKTIAQLKNMNPNTQKLLTLTKKLMNL